jgi:hypothetical protein
MIRKFTVCASIIGANKAARTAREQTPATVGEEGMRQGALGRADPFAIYYCYYYHYYY